MNVIDHNKYRLFDYENDLTNTNFELGQVVINKENQIGVVIQLHNDGDCRTDMFGNTSTDEVRLATLQEIEEFRPNILNDLFEISLEHEILKEIENNLLYNDFESYSEMIQCLLKNIDNQKILYNYLSDSAQETLNKGITTKRY